MLLRTVADYNKAKEFEKLAEDPSNVETEMEEEGTRPIRSMKAPAHLEVYDAGPEDLGKTTTLPHKI